MGAETPIAELALVAFGRDGSTQPVESAPARRRGRRVEIDRGQVVEWYENRVEGLEQGFTILAPPSPMEDSGVILTLQIGAATVIPNETGGLVIEAPSGRRLEYGSLAAWDASDEPLESTIQLVDATRFNIVIDDRAARYPITVDPLLTGLPDGLLVGFNGGRSAGDVNGDGFDDLIVGDSRNDEIFIFHGNGVGFAVQDYTTADTHIENDQPESLFGVGAGDVDGDGFDDVLLTSLSYVTSQQIEAGAMFLFYGGPGGIASGTTLDADSLFEGDIALSGFGSHAGPIGDVDADGFDDIIVGAFGLASIPAATEAVYIYYGSSSGIAGGGPIDADHTIESSQPNTQMGPNAAADVNGDGYDDLILGLPRIDIGQIDEGAAFIYHGGPSGILHTSTASFDSRFQGDQTSGRVAGAISSAGDVNDDGFEDILVRGRNYDVGAAGDGAVFVLLGSASGIANSTPATAHGLIENDQLFSDFATSIGGGGDFNDDGFDDFMVGAPGYDLPNSLGAVFVFFGSALGTTSMGPNDADIVLERDLANSRFGNSVSMAGDVNGDGGPDAIVVATATREVKVYHAVPEVDIGLGLIVGVIGLAISASRIRKHRTDPRRRLA